MQKNLAEPLFPERAISFALARRILLQNMQKDIDMPTCFIGPPGVGKTALVEDVCGDLKAHLCVIPLSCYDASELKGIPRVLPLEELRKLYPEHVKENNSGFVTYYAHNL
jgi:ABC-type transporter Mla maintaining outer membrane lipid asymmetry ATPase subunit MlaF